MKLNDSSHCKGSQFEAEGKQKFVTPQSEVSSLLVAMCESLIRSLLFLSTWRL